MVGTDWRFAAASERARLLTSSQKAHGGELAARLAIGLAFARFSGK
jgi:hypothetical protein